MFGKSFSTRGKSLDIFIDFYPLLLFLPLILRLGFSLWRRDSRSLGLAGEGKS